MGNQPFYHLRPNKHIDRRLFLQVLMGLSKVYSLTDYQYTGFGSYLFDDFKLLHESLGISSMVSLEKDPNEYSRAMFNLPYKCIELLNIGSTEYISELVIDDDSHNIFWLDYSSPTELGTQLADYISLLNLLNPSDIVRITLNANPATLGSSKNPDDLNSSRFLELQKRVQNTYFPSSLAQEDMTKSRYPLALLQIIKNITLQTLPRESPYKTGFMLPLFSTVYADSNHQMLTFTGIILESKQEEEILRDVLSDYTYNTFSWDNPCNIKIPALSLREIVEINKLLPDPEVQARLLDEFDFIFTKDKQIANSYISYYKYYPNYHHVSF